MRSLLTWQQLIKMNGVKKWKLINGNFHHRHTHQCEREENGKKYYVKEEREQRVENSLNEWWKNSSSSCFHASMVYIVNMCFSLMIYRRSTRMRSHKIFAQFSPNNLVEKFMVHAKLLAEYIKKFISYSEVCLSLTQLALCLNLFQLFAFIHKRQT